MLQQSLAPVLHQLPVLELQQPPVFELQLSPVPVWQHSAAAVSSDCASAASSFPGSTDLLNLKLNIYYYCLFIDGFGEFYFVCRLNLV